MSTFATRSLVSVESTTTIEGTEADNVDSDSLFRGCVLEGRWDFVLTAYRNDSNYHKIKINESRGTALHVAVNDGKVELVNTLVVAILNHEGREVLRDDSALKTTNERGDTPLHLASSRGFIGMCKCIIGELKERKDLIRVRNNKGETPLFRAVLTCHTKTFVYLHHVSKDIDVPLRNYDGDTILHHAIWREFLDLAIIIIHCYPGLVEMRNKDGATPLKVLACKPSAFRSGINLPWWKKILYYGILVEHLDAEKAIKSYMDKVEKYDQDNELKVNIHLESSEAKKAQIFVEKQYAISVRFVKSAVRLAFKVLSLSGLGVTAQVVGGAASSGPQENNTVESAAKNEEKETFVTVAKAGIVELVNELHNKVPSTLHDTTTPEKENLLIVAMKNIKYKIGEHHVDKKETAFLAAAKSGIVEIVFALQSKIPSAVHETNSNNENVLLVAVKNRQTKVVEVLRNHMDKELFDNLILEVDNRENTVLHLAAGTTSNTERTWQIAGAAMQMMWDIKWYQYIRALVPEHFAFRTNKDDKTAGEIFKQKHKDLVKESSEWLKETSNSCSVVAALIAGVSFATSSSVPGGTEKGKPELEGQPAFDAFAIASLIGLCFSVTALIMFLAILTSRKQAQDFRKSLPLKLLFGLSSLFVSIGSMLVSFCAAHFFVLKDKYKNILFPVYIATCLPVTFYAVVQFPLYADLLKAIFKKVPQPSISSSQF
ncbi:hypothetical protein AAZX31_18G096600 [Glycine max]